MFVPLLSVLMKRKLDFKIQAIKLASKSINIRYGPKSARKMNGNLYEGLIKKSSVPPTKSTNGCIASLKESGRLK